MFKFLYLSPIFFLASKTAADSLGEVRSWGYQLQNVSVAEVATAPFDLMVIDYSKDGSNKERFSAAEILQMKASGKKILSYLSIGEAEDYRFYFNSRWIKKDRKAICKTKLTSEAPDWLDQPNKDWCGNYKTRFWDSDWQKIIFGVRKSNSKSHLDRIIDADFDGVYLDIIDGYEYWLNKKGSNRRKQAAREMANFVIRLSRYARLTRGKQNFIIIPQNGAEILAHLDSKIRTNYLAAIDGIGSEDTFYFGSKVENNQLDPQTRVINQLKVFQSAGKKVFSVDYLSNDFKITDYFSRACALNFVPQVANRDLGSFTSMVLGPCPK